MYHNAYICGAVIEMILHIGSNIGDRENNLAQCRQLLSMHLGEVTEVSDIYATEAWGITDQPEFLNQAIRVSTLTSPSKVLKIIQKIECIIGKEKEFHWGPRRIDIDIIFYGDKIINESELTIPHPEMHKRAFVLHPLMDIIPDFMHPVYQKTISQLLDQCKDRSYAHKIEVNTVS